MSPSTQGFLNYKNSVPNLLLFIIRTKTAGENKDNGHVKIPFGVVNFNRLATLPGKTWNLTILAKNT